MENFDVNALFLIALAVFGVGYCLNHFVAAHPALATVVAVAAGVMGVMALVALF